MLVEHLKQINTENTKKLLFEKDMLDISILNADKVATNDNKIKAFLSDEYKVEEKFDGTKLTLWRNDKEWDEDYEKNWVVAFKNQILYGGEFETVDRNKVKKHSVGISQYAFIHDHLKKIHKNTKSFPKNTEIFIEFIQNKLTTTREYKNKHNLFIIAHSPATGEIEGGMLKTKTSGFFQDKVELYSKMLSLNLPPVVFKGKLDSVHNISKGIMNDNLKKAWNKHKDNYNENPYQTVKQTFLDFESTLGGKTEGVVLYSKSGKIYKFVQDDQYDKDVRFARKIKYQSNPEVETKYWKTINEISTNIIKNINYNFDKLNYQNILKEFSKSVNILSDIEIKQQFDFKFKAMKEEGKISETALTTDDIIQKIRDDLYLTGKQQIMDNLPENQNALFIGKFRVPTKAHISIIEEALKEFNHVVVCIVKAKKNVKESLPLDKQEELLEMIFGKKITVITHSSGNITSIVNKSPKRLKYVLAGSDRVESYKGQLKRHPNLSVIETKRDMESKENISATKVIEALKNGDEKTFKKMMHKKTWKMFDTLQGIFK